MNYDATALGRRISALRKNMNYSQIEFAEMLFISRVYLSQIEIGQRKPSLDLIVDIANLTGADMNYLVLAKGVPKTLKAELKTVIEVLSEMEGRL